MQTRRDGKTERWKDKNTERQNDGMMEWRNDRKTERLKDRKTERTQFTKRQIENVYLYPHILFLFDSWERNIYFAKQLYLFMRFSLKLIVFSWNTIVWGRKINNKLRTHFLFFLNLLPLLYFFLFTFFNLKTSMTLQTGLILGWFHLG